MTYKADLVTVEFDLPLLDVLMPFNFQNRRINLNDEIALEYEYDADESSDNLLYSCSLYYDY